MLSPCSYRSAAALTIALLAAVIAGCSAEKRHARQLERAQTYFQSGKYEEARIEYQNLLRDDPGNSTAAARLGVILFSQGAVSRALPFLTKAREASPECVETRLALAAAYLALGSIQEARRESEEALILSPRSDEAILLLAETALNADAVAATRRYLADHQYTAAFHVASATLAMREGNLASADESIRKALSLDPDSAPAHLVSANLHAKRDDLENAELEFKTAASLAPSRSAVHLRYSEFLARRGAPDKAKAYLAAITGEVPDFLPAWALSARLAMAEKDYVQALALLENVFHRDHDNYHARLLEAEILTAKGDAGDAIASLLNVHETFLETTASKILLARAYLANSDPAHAESVLKQLLSDHPDHPDGVLLLGEIYLRRGEPDRVKQLLATFPSEHPGYPQSQTLLAAAYLALNQPQEAETIYRAQCEETPDAFQGHLLLGLVLKEQHETEQARREFARADQLADENYAALRQLVEMDLAEKNVEAAHSRIRERLEKAPDQPALFVFQGRIYSWEKKFDEAEAALQKALDLDESCSEAYDLLLSIHLTTGEHSKAIARLERVVFANSQNIRALMLTAMIYEKMREQIKAIECYERIIAINPEFAPALNNLAYLYAGDESHLDRAYELATKARALLPENATTTDTLGWILYQRGDYRQALSLIAESAEKLSDNPEVLYHLGMANYMMGKTDEAEAALKKAVASNSSFPGIEDARERLALLSRSYEESEGMSVEQLEIVLTKRPGDLVARLQLGAALEKAGRFQAAAATYETAIEANPELLSAITNLAQLYAGVLNEPEKAMKLASRVRRLAPDDPQVAGLLGGIAYRTGNFAWAHTLLLEGSRKRNDDLQIAYDLAWAAYSLGRIPDARRAMERVAEKPHETGRIEDAQSFLELTNPGLENPSQFEEKVTALLKTNSGHVPALMIKAAIQKQRGDLEGAGRAYEQVLRCYPDFTPAKRYLTLLYAGKPDQRDKAYEFGMSARSALPDDAELARALGEISYHRGDSAYALQLLKESAARKPLDALGLFYLGMAHLERKQNLEAIAALDAALDAGLEEPFASETKGVLSKAHRGRE